jgi:hypothetical protein
MLANEILKVLSTEYITQEEMKKRITELCSNDIYVNAKNSKPVVNRFKFIKRECEKENRSIFKKVQKSEKYGLAWTNGYILCTFHDTDFPTNMIAKEEFETLDVDNTLLQCTGKEKPNTTLDYKTIKARLSALPTKKEKDNDIIEVSDALFSTRNIEKVFKFYNVNKLEMYVKKNCVAYGSIDNETPFIICPIYKK